MHDRRKPVGILPRGSPRSSGGIPDAILGSVLTFVKASDGKMGKDLRAQKGDSWAREAGPLDTLTSGQYRR